MEYYKKLKGIRMHMMGDSVGMSEKVNPLEVVAEAILYELWYSVAETIFERVCEVTELDADQIAALREASLRTNDFQIKIEK
jgi:hypothetical protein